ncbi:MAG: hypothetical protein ABH878_09330, partial [bacterium]
MSTRELQEKITSNMKNWQKIENASVAGTGKVMERTDNPIVRLVMEIIQRDSMLHYRVQQLIINSFESGSMSLNPDELASVWDMVEEHIQLEKKTIEYAREALGNLKGKKMVVQEYLLNYLMADESKHNKLLDD